MTTVRIRVLTSGTQRGQSPDTIDIIVDASDVLEARTRLGATSSTGIDDFLNSDSTISGHKVVNFVSLVFQ
jgi:hypothetical protein